MRIKQLLGMGLLTAVIVASTVQAQVGAPAAPGAAGAAGATPASAAAPSAAPGASPGFFAKCCAALDECRRKCCATPTGQMLNAMTAPAATFTGGVIPSFCPVNPSEKDLAQPGVGGAAAQAKKDALEAKARREAVKYLGTLDCRYYPEAEAALIAALRSDRVECVRLEAAISFANGCCCTKKVMNALEICVSGSDKDGNPAERSGRVRDFAYIALERCVSCYHEAPQEVEATPIEGKKEGPPAEKKEGGAMPNLTKADRELIERSRKTVAQYQARRAVASAAVAANSSPLSKGQRSLYHIIRYGMEGSTQTQPSVAQTTAPTATASSAMIVPPHDLPGNTSGTAANNTRILPDSPVSIATPEAGEQPGMSAKGTATPPTATAPTEKPSASAPRPVTIMPAGPAGESESNVSSINASVIAKPRSPDETVATLIDMLATGPTSADRQIAIQSLSSFDWKKSPPIVAGLVKAARMDSDRAVRIQAIRQIAAMKMDVPYVCNHLRYMEKDRDESVAQEATVCLQKIQEAK